MRAKYDMLKQKTYAELTCTDRRSLGKAIEVLTNLQVCEQIDGEVLTIAESTADGLGVILDVYPAKCKPARECDESKSKAPPDADL